MHTYWYGGQTFSTKEKQGKRKTFTFKQGRNCIATIHEERERTVNYIILPPHATTLIETSEVLGVGSNIGGALHSKVGLVAKGIGHIGTMLGPGYCGHLLISLHNITDEIIALRVGSTFISLSFDYLTTQVIRTSTTVSGHIDKFAELGIKIDEQTRDYLTADWKSNIDGIRQKMSESDAYKAYKKQIKANMWKEFKKYVNRKNLLAVLFVAFVFLLLLYAASWADCRLENPVWVERFWNVGCSGLVGSILLGLFRFLKDKK